MPTRRAIAIFFIVFSVTLAFDQGSKAWARGLPPHATPVISGFWDWQPAENPGSAFSMFAKDDARVILSIIAMLAIAGIGYAAWKTTQRTERIAYALLAGGALGNLVDRVRVGTVTDFVAWHVGDHHWPLFNVADVALVTGVALLLLVGIRTKLATPRVAA